MRAASALGKRNSPVEMQQKARLGKFLSGRLDRRIQTGAVAGGQQLAVTLCRRAVHNGPHGMDDATAGQIEGRGDAGPARGFGPTAVGVFTSHEFVAGQAQLHSGRRMDDVACSDCP